MSNSIREPFDIFFSNFKTSTQNPSSFFLSNSSYKQFYYCSKTEYLLFFLNNSYKFFSLCSNMGKPQTFFEQFLQIVSTMLEYGKNTHIFRTILTSFFHCVRIWKTHKDFSNNSYKFFPLCSYLEKTQTFFEQFLQVFFTMFTI